MISEMDIVIRLIVAAFLGGLVGFERERQNQPAGLRTHIILVIGCALAMVLSINIAMDFHTIVPGADPGRLASQVVSGIGFLGAGAIIRYGPNIKGLTTATSLWTMAVVGLDVGAGHYFSASMTTFILLFVLVAINVVEKRFIHPTLTAQITLTIEDRKGQLEELKQVISNQARIINSPSIQKSIKHKRSKISYTVKVKEGQALEQLMNDLSHVNGVQLLKMD